MLHAGPDSWVVCASASMRTVAGSIPMYGNILSWRLVMKSFLRPSLLTVDSSRAVFSYRRKSVHLVLVNHSGSLPRNSVVRLTDCLDITAVADWDIKPQIKHCITFFPIFFYILLSEMFREVWLVNHKNTYILA